jgi:23S rRNA pseudouridine2605 synthase
VSEDRIQKVLAQAGLGSRRVCDDLVAAGRVTVDGQPAVLGQRVDPARAVVHVDGKRVPVAESAAYLVLNKPRGMLSAMSDDRGRRCVGDLVAGREDRLFHVGRLDAETEGLLLLTNDGDLAHRLAHPSYEVTKVYLAEVTGRVGSDVGRQLRAGVVLADGPARADSFRVVGSSGERTQVELALHDGRNHIVRRMLEAVGHPVIRLVRTQHGAVRLGQLRPGAMRDLTRDEISALYASVGL